MPAVDRAAFFRGWTKLMKAPSDGSACAPVRQRQPRHRRLKTGQRRPHEAARPAIACHQLDCIGAEVGDDDVALAIEGNALGALQIDTPSADLRTVDAPALQRILF